MIRVDICGTQLRSGTEIPPYSGVVHPDYDHTTTIRSYGNDRTGGFVTFLGDGSGGVTQSQLVSKLDSPAVLLFGLGLASGGNPVPF